MTWTAELSRGHEAAKIAHLAVPYTRGRCLDIGCGTDKVWPTVTGVDSGHHFGKGAADILVDSADDLPFKDASWDNVFSSHALEHLHDTKKTLKEWWRVIKSGGHLTLYLPHKDLYPNIGQPGANEDHKHDFLPSDIMAVMSEVAQESGQGWELVEDEVRNRDWDVNGHRWGEYSFFQVYRKREDSRTIVNPWRKPEQKSVFVVRYGAFGDQLLSASVLPALKKEGWHVTWNATPASAEVLRHDPHIDAFWLQDKDQVPNDMLGPYQDQMLAEGRWDRVIDFCESVEGALLKLPNRFDHRYPDDVRRRLVGNVSYLERTHDIAGVPYEFAAKFYPSAEETAWARSRIAEMAGKRPIVMFAVVGSSPHKAYPWWNRVLAYTLERTDAAIVIVSDGDKGKAMQDEMIASVARERPNLDLTRVHATAGLWSIRQSMAVAQEVDVLVGPETGMLWSVAFNRQVRKIVILSHSSPENFGKHWPNLWQLQPVNTPCYPCHRLHVIQLSWNYCTQSDLTKAALCATNIAPERVTRAIQDAVRRPAAAE